METAIVDYEQTECTAAHYHALWNPLEKSPFPETTPWKVIQCSHFEGWQVNMVMMLTEYVEACAIDEIPPRAITLGWQEPKVFIVTCWALDNRNINKVCSTKEEADHIFEVYSRYMIKEASKEND